MPPESFRPTSLMPLGANWVSEEAEDFKELEFFGLVRCFSVKIEETSKLAKIVEKTAIFQQFFEVYSILTEKQRTKLKKLTSLKNFASFGTHIAPKLTIIVAQL